MAAMLGSNSNKVLRRQLCSDSSSSSIFNTITKAFSSRQLIILPRTIIIHHKIIIKIMKRNHQTEMESYCIDPRTTVRILRIILSPMSTLVQSLYKARHELFSRKKILKKKKLKTPTKINHTTENEINNTVYYNSQTKVSLQS